MLLEDTLKEYRYHCMARGFTKKTLINKGQELGAMQKYLKEKRSITEIESITIHDIKAFIRYKQIEKLQTSTIITGMKVLSAFFNWCVKEEYLTESPMNGVEYPKAQVKMLEGYSTDEVVKMIEAFSFKDYLECRNKAIIALFADTGIRSGELRGITTNSVKETTILVDGKGNKQRFVFISPSLKKILIRYERMREKYFSDRIVKSDTYFLTYQGDSLSHMAVWNVIKEVGKRTGIENVHPHKFRHFFSVSFIKNGGDVYTLSRLLGHSDVGTTQKYLRSMTNSELEMQAIFSSPLMNLKNK